MPLLKRKPFVPNPIPDDLDSDGEYFVCKATGEVFEDYEQFFERVIVCNSLLWTCSITGRPNLTYPEAVACEKKALSVIEMFPQHLRRPVLYLASITQRTRINDMNDDVYVYIRDVYFNNETVEAIHNDEWWEARVVESFLVQSETPNGDDDQRLTDEPDWDHIRYRVQLWDDELDEYIEGVDGLIVVDTSCIRREKSGHSSINQDKCKLFLKHHCEQIDGIWQVKPENMKKYNLIDVQFSEFICLEEPKFTKSSPVKKQPKGKSPKLPEVEKRKLKELATLETKDKAAKTKKEAKEKQKLSPEELAAVKERARVEKGKLKEELAAKQAEEKARLKEIKEHERQKAKEEKQMIADKLKEWNKPRDDLLCDDLMPFPAAHFVPSKLSTYFGDMVMILEFFETFGEHIGLESRFPDGVTLDILEKALFESDISGPLADMLCVLLAAIFACIDEEEAELELAEKQADPSRNDVMDEITESGEVTYKELINSATAATHMCQRTHGINLKDFQLDSLTISEVLRIHFLSSGAKSSSASIKFRYQARGGYTSLDDPGLELKKEHPHLLKALGTGNIFDFDAGSKIVIISTLIHQLLSYASIRDIIEDSMEQFKSYSYELKQLQWAEQRREREETQNKHKRKLEQKLNVLQSGLPGEEKMETDADDKTNGDLGGSDSAKAAQKLAKKIIAETAKLDPTKLQTPDTNRTRRKNVQSEEFDWKEYDMTEWNNLEERYLTEEDIEILNLRRKEIESRKKQEYLDKEAEVIDRINSLRGKSGIQSLGRDRWGRTYWSFNTLPGLHVDRDDAEIISQPCDLDVSTTSEKENVPLKLEAKATNCGDHTVNGENIATLLNSILQKDPSYTAESCWIYYNSIETIDQLVNALNSRGNRESVLKQKIISNRRHMQNLMAAHPNYTLTENSLNESTKPISSTNQNIKSRSRLAKGLTLDTSAQESLELNLREMLLDLEERISVGALGNLKVSDRAAWRAALEDGSYEAQDLDLSSLAAVNADESFQVIRDLSRALLQLYRAVEQKYMCRPLGFAESDGDKKKSSKKSKKHDSVADQASGEDDSQKIGDRWCESLLSSTSLSQIFLHMCTLESSIIWSKSALNARCRLCRRKGDGEKMLLCDMCDRGHHMYCLKPAVKEVPRGDWFCPECRPKTTRSRQLTHRKSFIEEDEPSGNSQSDDEDSTADDSVYDEETASSSEEDRINPKIKQLKEGARLSGRSSPTNSNSGRDSKSRRSRTSTPDVESGRQRRSAAPSPESITSKKTRNSLRNEAPPRSKSSWPNSPQEKKPEGRGSVGSSRVNVSEDVAQLTQCEELLRSMTEMDECWPFLVPVNRREVPDYYTIIKRPMDCQTILSKAKTVKYSNVAEMIADIRLMFKNCSVYNEDASDIYKMGEKMSKYFEKQVKSLQLEVNTAKKSKKA